MKPERIIIIRHGESQGNTDKSIYRNVPDYAIPLTAKGRQQSHDAGIELHERLGDDSVMFYVSPFWRTRETYAGIAQAFTNYVMREDPRLREQEWGHLREVDVTKAIEAKRDAYGRYFFRMPDGENGADVEDRVTTFLDTLHRDFEKPSFPRNVVLVTHGFTARIILKRWFHLSTENFEKMANPPNCGYFSLKCGYHLNSKYSIEIGPKDEPIPAPWIWKP